MMYLREALTARNRTLPGDSISDPLVKTDEEASGYARINVRHWPWYRNMIICDIILMLYIYRYHELA